MGSQSSTSSASSSAHGSCSDPAIAQQIANVTGNLCDRWIRKDFTIKDVKVYTRRVRGSCAAQGGGHGVIGGFCHTFLIIETDSDSYILERLQEGVKLCNVTNTLDNDTSLSAIMCESNDKISSKQLALWIKSQSERTYNLATNNCIHFVREFGKIFTPHKRYNKPYLEFLCEATTTLSQLKDQTIQCVVNASACYNPYYFPILFEFKY
eukprot:166099_1